MQKAKGEIAGIFITVLFSLLKDFFAMAFYTTRTDFWSWYYGFRGKFINSRRRHTLKNNDTSKINDD
jgi:hypothetical protein